MAHQTVQAQIRLVPSLFAIKRSFVRVQRPHHNQILIKIGKRKSVGIDRTFTWLSVETTSAFRVTLKAPRSQTRLYFI